MMIRRVLELKEILIVYAKEMSVYKDALDREIHDEDYLIYRE
jgi:hypothetical protein